MATEGGRTCFREFSPGALWSRSPPRETRPPWSRSVLSPFRRQERKRYRNCKAEGVKKLVARQVERKIDQGSGDRLVLYVFPFDDES